VSNRAAELVLRNWLRANGDSKYTAGEAVPKGLAAEPFGLGDGIHLQHKDQQVDGEPEFTIHQRTRSSANDRERRAANWERTEAVLTDMMVKDVCPHPCHCARHVAFTVRCIDLNSYEHRVFEYCNCARSCSILLKEGYIPCAPMKPRTAFSIWLLKVLHEQSVLGYISRSAWSGGLRALYESEKKAVLSPFDREVCTPPYLAVRLNTETCSYAMPTTTGSQ